MGSFRVHSSVHSGQQLRSLRHFQVPLGNFCGFLRADRRIDLAFDTSSDMLPRVTFTAVGLEGLQQGSEGPTVIRITRLRPLTLGSSL